LGSISVQEGIEYFKNMVSHKKNFIYKDDDDGKAIDLAFCKGKPDDRKEWIKKFKVWKSNKNNLFIFRKRFIIIV